jgi:DNA topoisomerase VI subunit A
VLFGDVSCVSGIVQSLEDYWCVPSSSFNVLAACRGMMAGPIGYLTQNALLKAQRSNAELDRSQWTSQSLTWACTWSEEGQAGPFVYKSEDIVDASQLHSLTAGKDISWVLVVEKETVYSERVQELNRDMDGPNSFGHGIILTVRCRLCLM